MFMSGLVKVFGLVLIRWGCALGLGFEGVGEVRVSNLLLFLLFMFGPFFYCDYNWNLPKLANKLILVTFTI